MKDPVQQHPASAHGAQPSPRGRVLAAILAILVVGLAIGLLVGGRLSLSGARFGLASGPARLALGEPAPDFALAALDGGVMQLGALRGRPVVLNFWATWCAPCRIEMPEIARVHAQFRDQNLSVISIDLQEDPKIVRAAVTRGRFPWTFVVDPDGAVARSYQISSLPSTVFIDRAGIVREVFVGAMTREMLEQKVQALP